MVLQAEMFPYGGFQHQGYGHHDYYGKNWYGHKEDHSDQDCENGSSIQVVKPHITTPEPPEHYMAGHESYSYQDSNNYGKHHSYPHDHDSYGHGYSRGTHHLMSDGMYGKAASQQQGFYGQQSHPHAGGYPKPSYGAMQNGSSLEYESHHGASYMQKGPSKYESVSYDYYGEARNRGPSSGYEKQQHFPNRNWGANKGFEWKGI